MNRVIKNLYDKYREEKLAHAFLLETNNINKCTLEVLELIKMINCSDEYSENCSKCNLCKLIDNNTLPSLIVIEPDGASIKKGQVIDLKNKFATVPVYSRFNNYIIKNAELLNQSSANTMLKFLEEPTDNVLGFFITSNKEKIIDTIKSRCQFITINFEEEDNKDIERYFIEYLNEIYKESYDCLYIKRKDLLELLVDRKGLEREVKVITEKIINYVSYLNGVGEEEDIYEELFFKKINISNSKRILEIFTFLLQMLSSNVNIDLVMDYLILEVGDINE